MHPKKFLDKYWMRFKPKIRYVSKFLFKENNSVVKLVKGFSSRSIWTISRPEGQKTAHWMHSHSLVSLGYYKCKLHRYTTLITEGNLIKITNEVINKGQFTHFLLQQPLILLFSFHLSFFFRLWLSFSIFIPTPTFPLFF